MVPARKVVGSQIVGCLEYLAKEFDVTLLLGAYEGIQSSCRTVFSEDV